MHSLRLTEPLSSNKIYVTSSLKHGANKCLNELNKCNTPYDNFTMMDINTKIKYRFILDTDDVTSKKHHKRKDMVNELYERIRYLESQISASKSDEYIDKSTNITDVKELK